MQRLCFTRTISNSPCLETHAITHAHVSTCKIHLGEQNIAHADRFYLCHTAHVKSSVIYGGKNYILSCLLFCCCYLLELRKTTLYRLINLFTGNAFYVLLCTHYQAILLSVKFSYKHIFFIYHLSSLEQIATDNT